MNSLLAQLTERGITKTYRKHSLLILQGESGDQIYIVVSGRVRAFSTGHNFREITHGEYGPGEYFGEMSLDGGLRSASVETMEPTKCAVISRQTLRSFIQENPEFAFEVIAKLIQRIRNATDKTASLALSDVYGRLVLFLATNADPPIDGCRKINKQVSHQDIANSIGCSREMVSRLLKDLEAGAYLKNTDRRIYLLKNLPKSW
jgi:CRP/FNR family transcriptional regulator, cyclic AMP receptor protein